MRGLWRRLAAFAFAPALAFAQQEAPVGIFRGTLVAWTGNSGIGNLTFRTGDGQLYRCGYDEKTYLEHDNQRIAMLGAVAGDRIEVLSDHKPGAAVCYARTIQVLDAPLARTVPGVRPRLRAASAATEFLATRGNLTFAGVVLRITSERLTIRTRTQGEQTFLMRGDTRFLASGALSDSGSLTPSTRVFIRAGRNMDGAVEAYQVVWGDILQP